MSKPIYCAILKFSPQKPVIIFVPSRKQARLTSIDILTFAAAEGEPNKFFHADECDVKHFIERVSDKVRTSLLYSRMLN